MAGTTSTWEGELRGWLTPFLDRLGHKARRRMCPLYVMGLIGPGDRKSVQPMAERLAPGDYDQLHHFVAAGVWDALPLETELLVQADRLVGGDDAVLVIDDTAVPKKGTHSVGVAAQYASALGKTANCQTLVSLTLARGEVPVMVALRLFLPHLPAEVHRPAYDTLRQAAAAMWDAFPYEGDGARASAAGYEPPSAERLLVDAVDLGDEHAIKLAEACRREHALLPDDRYRAAADTLLRRMRTEGH